MTNAEKYETISERIEAHQGWCETHRTEKCRYCNDCAFAWLEQEAVTEEELKPCPFCGGKARVDYDRCRSNLKTYYFVICEKCGTRTNTGFLDKEDAIEMWNRRVNND